MITNRDNRALANKVASISVASRTGIPCFASPLPLLLLIDDDGAVAFGFNFFAIVLEPLIWLHHKPMING